jgi:hypothetical protein
MNASFTNLSALDLRRAAEIKDRIEALQSELNNILSQEGGTHIAGTPYSSRRMSAAGLARIRAAQKARWARFRSKKGPAPAPRRRMSAAAKAKIAAIARERWRKAKAAGRKAL